MKLPLSPSDAQLRRRYLALLHGEPVFEDGSDRVLDSEYARWRELKRMVVVYGLPRDDRAGSSASSPPSPSSAEQEEDKELEEVDRPDSNEEEEEEKRAPCSLRGQVWKAFLGVETDARSEDEYSKLAARGASACDGDIRNDTFRTFRGDPAFAQRVPEEKLVRLLNVFINELGSCSTEDEAEAEAEAEAEELKRGVHDGMPRYIRYVQGMNILCAPLLYVLPEADAYYTFCQLIVRHCPQYMAPKLKGVEQGCVLVDKCLEMLDPDLFQHLSTRGITARIYALPLILSLFACVPPLHELLRVWDVLFAVGVHFVVVLAVAHTVLLREQLLQKDMDLMKVLSLRFAPPLQADLLVSVALQLLHRLPDELMYEIARHPFEDPDVPASLPFAPAVSATIVDEMRKQNARKARVSSHRSRRGSRRSDKDKAEAERAAVAASAAVTAGASTALARPRWKL